MMAAADRGSVRQSLGVGWVAGLLSGLLGVAGGAVLVPGLRASMRLTQREAAANSLLAIIPIATVGAVLYERGSGGGVVNVGLALALALGSVLGAPIGARLASHAPDRLLRLCFGVLLLTTGVLLAWPGR